MSKPANRPMTALEWGLLLTLSLLWGGSFFFNGIAVKALPVLTVVAARVSLAAVLLWIVLPIAGVAMPRDRKTWTAFFAMGLLNNVIPFSLIVWGQAHIASGVASILNATTPLFGVVVAHFLTSDEKMNAGKLAGVGLGIVGVAVMFGEAALRLRAMSRRKFPVSPPLSSMRWRGSMAGASARWASTRWRRRPDRSPLRACC